MGTRRTMCQVAAQGICDILDGREPANIVRG